MDPRLVERLRHGQATLYDERLAEVATRSLGKSLPGLVPKSAEAGSLGEALVESGHLESSDLDRFSLEVDLIDRLETALGEFLPESVREQAADPERRAGRYVLTDCVEKVDSGEVWRAWDVGFGEWVLWCSLEKSADPGDTDDPGPPTRPEGAREVEERVDSTILVLDWPGSDSVPGLGDLETLLSGRSAPHTRRRLSPRLKAVLGIGPAILIGALAWSLVSVRGEEARAEAHRQADALLAPVEGQAARIQELFGRVAATQEPGTLELLQEIDLATQAALIEAPEHLRARVLRGWMLHLSGRHGEATQLFDEILVQCPRDHEAALGWSFEPRLALLTESQPLEPLIAPRHNGVAFVHLRGTDEHQGAVEEVYRALPELPEGVVNDRLVRARAAMASAGFDRVGEILLAGDRAPESLGDEALGLLAWSALGDGRPKDAETHADLLIQRHPQGQGLELRALARAAQGRFEEALSDLRSLPESALSHPPVSALGPVWSFLATGEGDPLGQLDRLTELTPEDPAPLLARSFVRLNLGDLKGSSQDAARAIDLDPRNPEAHYRLALTLESGSEAVAALDRALKIAPDIPEYLGQRALAHLQAGHLAEAERDARLASESDSDDPRWKFALGLALVELGDFKAGEAALTRTIETGYAEPVAFLQRGRARLARKDCAGALDDFASAEDLQVGITEATQDVLSNECGG